MTFRKELDGVSFSSEAELPSDEWLTERLKRARSERGNQAAAGFPDTLVYGEAAEAVDFSSKLDELAQEVSRRHPYITCIEFLGVNEDDEEEMSCMWLTTDAYDQEFRSKADELAKSLGLI